MCLIQDDKDLCDEIISTSTGDSLFMVKRNSEVLSSLTRDRAPPPKNRRRPSLMKRHETSEIFTSSEEELDKVNPLDNITESAAYTECKYGGPLGCRPGRVVKVRLVRPRCFVLTMLPLKSLASWTG